MTNGGNHLPKPEAIWVALAIVVWAIAAALGPRRRAGFIDAMAAATAQHEARERVLAFGRNGAHSREMSRSVRAATAWLRRLEAALRTAAR